VLVGIGTRFGDIDAAAGRCTRFPGRRGWSTWISTVESYPFRRARGSMIAGGSIEQMLNHAAAEIFGEQFSKTRAPGHAPTRNRPRLSAPQRSGLFASGLSSSSAERQV